MVFGVNAETSYRLAELPGPSLVAAPALLAEDPLGCEQPGVDALAAPDEGNAVIRRS